jgi:hypothetical protein
MDPIDSLESLDSILKALTSRCLTVYLTDPDRRGAVVTHGFHTPDELARLRAHYSHAPASAAPPEVEAFVPVRGGSTGAPQDHITRLESQLATTLEELSGLKSRVGLLEAAVEELRKRLGTPSGGG